MSKIKITDINASLKEIGWKCISNEEEYKNLDSELEFLCDEGHKIYSSWKRLRNNIKCPICEKNPYKAIKKVAAKKKERRIMALDQATRISGYSVFEGNKLLDYGTYKTTLNKEQVERNHELVSWLYSMIEKWKPDEIGIEGIQYQPNEGVLVFESLARLQGCLLDMIYSNNIAYRVCPTNTWRAACGVKGKIRAQKKRSMQEIIKKLYDVTVTEDEADAIGIGIYMINNPIIKPNMIF